MKNKGAYNLICAIYGCHPWRPGMILGNTITVKCSKNGTASIANKAITKVINQNKKAC